MPSSFIAGAERFFSSILIYFFQVRIWAFLALVSSHYPLLCGPEDAKHIHANAANFNRGY
jgi:hypothetical protein